MIFVPSALYPFLLPETSHLVTRGVFPSESSKRQFRPKAEAAIVNTTAWLGLSFCIARDWAVVVAR